MLAVVQLMAAAEASRDVCYFTFKDAQFVDALCDIHDFIRTLQLTVGLYTRTHARSHTHTHTHAHTHTHTPCGYGFLSGNTR